MKAVLSLHEGRGTYYHCMPWFACCQIFAPARSNLQPARPWRGQERRNQFARPQTFMVLVASQAKNVLTKIDGEIEVFHKNTYYTLNARFYQFVFCLPCSCKSVPIQIINKNIRI